MKKLCSNSVWTAVFIPKIFILLSVSATYAQEMNSEQLFDPDSNEDRRLPVSNPLRRSSNPSETWVNPRILHNSNPSRSNPGGSSGESVYSNALDHRYSHRRPVSEDLQSELTPETDFNSRNVFHRTQPLDDDESITDSGSQFPQSAKPDRPKRKFRRRKNQRISDAFLRRVTPDFTSADTPRDEPLVDGLKDLPHFVKDQDDTSSIDDQSLQKSLAENHHLREQIFTSRQEEERSRHPFDNSQDRNRHSGSGNLFRSPEDQLFVPDSELDRREISQQSDYVLSSGVLDSESSSDGNEGRYHLGPGPIFVDQQEENSRDVFHQVRDRNSHSNSHADLSQIPKSERQNPFHQSRTRFSEEADTDSHTEWQSYSGNDRYADEERLADPELPPLEPGYPQVSDYFHSNDRIEQEFVENPEYPLTNERSNGLYQKDDESESPVRASGRDDRLYSITNLLQGFRRENYPEHLSSAAHHNLENSEEEQERHHEYPPLDICMEGTHEFYDRQIFRSSPVYEIEPFLPRNFSEVFLRELRHRFRQYKHPNVGDSNSVCDESMVFGSSSHANTRALCPFRWDVSSYNSARYPPYLMTARCSCQRSKLLHQQRPSCKEKKGRLSVLWRVGCNNGKHLYMEGWDEISVACVPEDFMYGFADVGIQDPNGKPSV